LVVVLLLVGCDEAVAPGFRDATVGVDLGLICAATGAVIEPEICDFADNDCDGQMDEGFELLRDPLNCGVCGNVCAYAHGRGVCQVGECVFAGCDEGYYDGDGDPSTGCEARCDAEPGPERCDGRDNDCDGTADEDFALDQDLDNCGACGVICRAPRAQTRCEVGTCVIDRCEPGFGDFDRDLNNGCEADCDPREPGPERCDEEDNDCDGLTDEGFDFERDGEHCGQCGHRCAYANGVGACRVGACELVGCEPGFVDADGDAENGCEARCVPSEPPLELCDERDNDCNGVIDDGVDKQTDVENCGGCGALDERFVCRLPNAEVVCVEGACAVDGCVPGFADFDGMPSNGCEGVCQLANGGVELCNQLDDDCDGRVDEVFDLEQDVAHCGACNARCVTGNAQPLCVAGRCQVGACPDGFVDADQNPLNGCEYDCVPTLDPTEVCDHADNDCDGVIDEGFDVLSDAAHCGQCDARCAPEHALAVCSAGQCDIGGCDEGWFDADFDLSNGCEIRCTPSDDGFEVCDGLDNDCDGLADEDFDLQADLLNCGACGQACGLPNGVAACADGACRDVGCAVGWHDLDGARGCEYRCTASAPPVEQCNGRDDDCDGLVDEGFDLLADAGNCGACGVSCAAPNGVVACQAGLCGLTACTPGFVDANDDPVDGCELRCVPNGAEVCNHRDDDCDGRTDEDFDLLNDGAHCGGCGVVCELPHGTPFCNGGACAVLRCEAGFVDVDGQAVNGCECALSNGGVEVCDGLDNDCNGIVDDADRVVPPAELDCGGRGVCRGVRPACRAAGWVCPYPETYEVAEARCDGLDNDCDGQTDEPFPDLGTPCAVGVGACRDEGSVACVALNRATCTARARPERAEAESCNGVDDDCDGRTDEQSDALVRISAGQGVQAFEIYAYEASRTDATANASGQSFARACSKSGVAPWANVDHGTAQAACEAAGLRLCSAAEWRRACAGDGDQAYPYGDAYAPLACNGHDFDTDGLLAGNQDEALPTASLNQCRRVWFGFGVYDLSGNVWEWTAESLGDGAARGVRGGSFGNIGGGMTCTYTLAQPVATARENVGFRCCR
jgi:hypothetical protein